ncbi:MAG: 4Fe-4S dicluster domain-containing protein [Caldisericia bacterium]|nr:4Fe-4S dicluster domain-containing protein [Caldisericia bacterium]
MQELVKKAKELIESKEVDLLIGYQSDGEKGAKPLFVKNTQQAEKLIFNQYCLNNLVTYLKRPDVKALKKVAVVAKGCDIRSFVMLLSENQVSRDAIFIIGMTCDHVVSPDGTGENEKCTTCKVHNPHLADVVLGAPVPEKIAKDKPVHYAQLEKLNAMSQEERWAFWQEELSRCIRCYACRQACPLCYCERCIVDFNTPQWIDTRSNPRGNFAWNIVRALHLAGRCINCGECERVCPANIPLMLLNQSLQEEAQEKFAWEAGYDPESQPPLTTFRKEDDEDFIR